MGLVSRYQLNGNANDSWGSNNGTNYGATFGSGVFGQCANFDGINDYIDLGSTGTIANLTSPLSFSFWLKPNDTTVYQCIFESANTIDETLFLQLLGGDLKFIIRTLGTWYIKETTAPIINQWTYVSITYDKDLASDNLKFYYNGVLVDTFTFSAQLTEANKKTIIGNTSRGTSLFYNGSLDDIRIYNHALTEQEIKQLYFFGGQSLTTLQRGLELYLPFESTLPSLGTDASGNGNHGTVYGVTQGVGKIGGAGVFDGNNDFIDCGINVRPVKECTYMTWINANLSQSNVSSALFNSGWGMQMYLTISGVVYFRLYLGGNQKSIVLDSAIVTANAGSWHHYSVTYDGTTFTLYVDGKYYNSIAATGDVDYYSTYPNLFIGKYQGSSAIEWGGSLSKLKIFNIALSEQNIRREMIGLNAII